MKVNRIDFVSAKNKVQNKSDVNNQTLKTSYPQINQLSNLSYKQISFGRSWSEHKSWGAVIDPETKESSFKLFTYPDSKRVTVTVIKKDNKQKPITYELQNSGYGIFETASKIPAGSVEHGDRYFYTIYKGNGHIDRVKDPYSFRQEKLMGESTIYDHSLYKWSDTEWFKSDKSRISRKANLYNGLTPVNAARIYELNIASFTKDGNFESSKEKLERIKKQGFNAIELMPVENTFSFNWGYDGVDKFAPSEHLGGPDSLKDLINEAHNVGLNVIMDIVPNHLGPDGASLLKTGPYIKGNNNFGEAFNYEGKDSKFVRDFIVNAALNWLDNYHCDGLRFDMTKFMESDYTMKQIAAELNYHRPHAFLIAEDSRSGISTDNYGNYWVNKDEPHDKRVMNPLLAEESGEGKSENIHCQAIDNISNFNTNLARLGFNSEWDFNYFHSLKDLLYGNYNLHAFEKAAYCSQDRVKYVMSHDEIGNFEGSRLIPKLMTQELGLNYSIVLNSDDRQRTYEYAHLKGMSIEEARQTITMQKAQLVSEQLATLYQTGRLDRYSNMDRNLRTKQIFKDSVLKPLGISSDSEITYNKIKTAFDNSMSKFKMATALTFSIPGPKMIFQGDENADLTPFRFFREFQSAPVEYNLSIEKGYEAGRRAFRESKLGTIRYSNSGIDRMNKFENLVSDLNKLSEENKALVNGHLIISSTVIDDGNNILGLHSKDDASGNEIFTISNFGHTNQKYNYKFPMGKWIEILNTDSKKYGGSGNVNHLSLDTRGLTYVNMPAHSTSIFKRIG